MNIRTMGVLAVFALASCELPSTTSVTPESPPEGVTAIVQRVTDGDTLLVEIDGETEEVRIFGINAPERDECLGDESRFALADLTDQTVILTDTSLDQYDRILADLWFGDDNIGLRQLREGMALVYGTGEVPQEYLDAQEAARDSQQGIWSPFSCGTGPLPEIRITEVEADPPGPDEQNLDGEWVTITNRGPTTVDISGFVIRDESSVNRYYVPQGTFLAPEGYLTVITGCRPSPSELGWCSDTPVWNNSGDSAILLDQSGRIIDHVTLE